MNRWNSVVVLLLVCLFVGVAMAQVPAPPANLTVHRGLTEGVVLQWDSSAGAGYYKIYKSRDGSEFYNIAATEHLGYIDWMIEPFHHYAYYVRAFMNDVGSGSSDTVFFNTFPPPPSGAHGVITGRITDDSTGLPLREAVVKFFGPNGLWNVRTHTDTGGVYWAELDTGRYVLRAEKFGYFPEWFDNALQLSGATVIPVHQDTTTADFGLRPIPIPVPINVTGVVRDSSSAQPLANTFVAFLRPFAAERHLEDELGLFGGLLGEHFDLPGFGNMSGVVWFGFTDTNGQYTAHLRSDLRYIAMAFKPGYIPKFYQDKHSPFDADRISSPHDTSGIDFNLVQNPLAFLSISGTVHDSSNSGVVSHVVLIRATIFGPRLVRYRTTDSLGNYNFHNLSPGIFLVKAVPLNYYAPAWYKAGSCGVSNWHNADSIRLTGNRAGVDICVLPLPGDGLGRIAGLVTSPGNVSAASSAQGVTVYAVANSTNAVVGYDVTEDDGSFSIGNLAPGTYHIVVDKEGYSAVTNPTVTIGASNNYEATNNAISIAQDQVTSVGEGTSAVPTAYRLDQNYPNPFNPSTTIRFEIPKSGIVAVKIYNLIGQEVAVLASSTLDAGTYTLQWNGTDQSGRQMGSGIYFVKLVASSPEGGAKVFTQTRKIMLLK